jgi:hypothetical protein
MRAVIALVALALVVTACVSPSPSATQFPSPTPVPAVTRRLVFCGDLGAGECADAAEAALATAALWPSSNPVRIDLGRGVFCANAELLLQATTCLQHPREGERWIGHALVTFADSSAQAYMNIVQSGRRIGAEFIALATPRPSPSPS